MWLCPVCAEERKSSVHTGQFFVTAGNFKSLFFLLGIRFWKLVNQSFYHLFFQIYIEA